MFWNFRMYRMKDEQKKNKKMMVELKLGFLTCYSDKKKKKKKKKKEMENWIFEPTQITLSII